MHVLAVCTGNICRSPLAALVLANELREFPQVTVSSAGTHALVDQPMTDEMRAVAERLGLAGGSAHRARQLTRAMIAEADLILGLSREHRRSVVELDPRVLRRTFTLREFARLSAALDTDLTADSGRLRADGDPADAPALAAAAAARRGLMPAPHRAEDDDVIDPYGRSAAIYDRCADQLVPAARITADVLRRFVSPGG